MWLTNYCYYFVISSGFNRHLFFACDKLPRPPPETAGPGATPLIHLWPVRCLFVCVSSSVTVVLCMYCHHRQPSVALAQGHTTHVMWHVNSILACSVADETGVRISATFDVLIGNQWSSLVGIGKLPEYGTKVVKVYVCVRLLMTCAGNRLQSSATGQNCDMVHWLVVRLAAVALLCARWYWLHACASVSKQCNLVAEQLVYD